MCEIAFSEGHKEADSFDSRNVKSQRLNFLVMKKVHVFFADLREVVNSLDLHWLCFYPVAVLPVGALCGNLTDVDLRVKVCGKRISMVACIAVQNVNVIDLIKIMFQSIGRKYTCYARIKAASQKSCDSCFFITLFVSPLPFVFKFGCILRLIVCSVHIVNSCFQAGIHNMKILIRKRKI